jgi:LCP family protein required for cell wall assembly
MSDGRNQGPRGRNGTPANGGSLANENGLRALGDAVDRKHGAPASRANRPRKRRSRARVFAVVAVSLVVALILGAGGIYLYGYYKFGQVHKIGTGNSLNPYPVVSGKPFNILEIGSDSRAGLSGHYLQLAGGNLVGGQRSDVIKIMHVDPTKHTVTIVSIPRDTLVTLLANQSIYTNYNKINVNYGNGPALLVRTIEANFGIPISHVVQVSFGGLINMAQAVGGVYMNFPYPSRDKFSQINIRHPGCQLLTGWRPLAVVRSRHFEWFQNGVWNSDPLSDISRIQRQDAFLRSLMNAIKSKYSITNVNALINAVPNGVAIDDKFSFDELLGYAYDFRNFTSANLRTYTLPVYDPGHQIHPYGDVLLVDEPRAQKLLVKVFGHSLITATNPPPDANLQPVVVPNIPVSTTTTTKAHHSTTKHKKKPTGTTTTTRPPGYAFFNPVPCVP